MPAKALIFDFFGVLYVDGELNQPLLTLLKKLTSDYKIGLLSNMDRSWLDSFSDRQVVEDLFDVIVLSGDEGIAKPDPRIFQTTAKRLHVEVEECVMVDDLAYNVEAAEALGMRTVLYKDIDSLSQLLQ